MQSIRLTEDLCIDRHASGLCLITSTRVYPIGDPIEFATNIVRAAVQLAAEAALRGRK